MPTGHSTDIWAGRMWKATATKHAAKDLAAEVREVLGYDIHRENVFITKTEFTAKERKVRGECRVREVVRVRVLTGTRDKLTR